MAICPLSTPFEFGQRNGRNGKSIRNLDIRNPIACVKPLRASPVSAVTQLYYAREGIITPEMEFIAIRENLGSARASPVRSETSQSEI